MLGFTIGYPVQEVGGHSLLKAARLAEQDLRGAWHWVRRAPQRAAHVARTALAQMFDTCRCRYVWTRAL